MEHVRLLGNMEELFFNFASWLVDDHKKKGGKPLALQTIGVYIASFLTFLIDKRPSFAMGSPHLETQQAYNDYWG